MFRRPVAALSCVVLFALAVPAAATPVTVTLDQASGGVHGPYGSTGVKIDGRSGTVSAGAFDVKVTSPEDYSIPGLGARFAAWCLDVNTTLDLASDYEVTSNPFSPSPDLTSRQMGLIRAVFNVYFERIGENLAVAQESAGIQLALWEIVNEDEVGNGFDLSEGDFDVTNAPAANARNYANDLLADAVARLTDPNATDSYRVIFLQSLDQNGDKKPDSQSFAAPALVPLPAAGALLLAALAGLGLARRRQVRNS